MDSESHAARQMYPERATAYLTWTRDVDIEDMELMVYAMEACIAVIALQATSSSTQ
jgi:hypothetical protein